MGIGPSDRLSTVDASVICSLPPGEFGPAVRQGACRVRKRPAFDLLQQRNGAQRLVQENNIDQRVLFQTC